MKKINVIMRSEDIDPAYLIDKVAVVINVLFSTSAIVHALLQGAAAVHVRDCWQTARQATARLAQDHDLIAEPPTENGSSPFANHGALTMDSPALRGKSLVLTCRATSVALYQAEGASHVYVAALLNAPAMVKRLTEHKGQRLELICTGPGGRANLIDLYAAGYLIEHLMQECPNEWMGSDSALMARAVYLQYLGQPHRCLNDSPAGALLNNDSLSGAAQDACEVGLHDIVAQLRDGAVISSRNRSGAPIPPQAWTAHHGL